MVVAIAVGGTGAGGGGHGAAVVAVALEVILQVSQENMLQYIHFNRHQNSLLINDLKKQIEAHHPLPPNPPAPTSAPPFPPPTPPPGQVLMLVRKEVGNGNPVDYFDKTFAEYKEGFSSEGMLKQQQ